MKSEYNAPPNRERLVERLRQLGQEVDDKLSCSEARDVINAALLDQAVCSRALIDGKQQCLSFSAYHAAVYGEKWKYVPHNERGLLTEIPK